jgi:hypothetical protein
MMSVYPPLWASRLLGGHSPNPFNQAIACWAMEIATATKQNEDVFTPAEWGYLLEALPMTAKGGFRGVDPSSPTPGHGLASIVRQRHALAGLIHGKDADKHLAALTTKLEKLDYTHAWAVITACQFKTRHEQAGPAWWTLASRQAQ